MKPTNPEIKALDQYGHTIYLNLSDSVAVYFQNSKPHHVRFWALPTSILNAEWARTWAEFQLRAIGWSNLTLGKWEDQDIDDAMNGGLIARCSYASL